MNDYLLLMHDDSTGADESTWGEYFAKLRRSGAFQGGSSIGEGVCVSKAGDSQPVTKHLSGYIKIQAESFAQAREMVAGNPVFEAGGTVEIRELPED